MYFLIRLIQEILAGNFGAVFARMLPLLLLALPAAVRSQSYSYTTNNGTITITDYIGPGGAVTIPRTIHSLPVTTIGDSAFYARNSLTIAMIPDTVSYIGVQAFGACAGLSEIVVDPLNPSFSSVDGVLFNKSQTSLIQYPGGKTGDYTVPGSVTTIAEFAFSHCAGPARVTIPDNVTSIGDYAFRFCATVSRVVIGDGVVGIGDYAFNNCAGLTNVLIGDSVATIGSSAFADCPILTTATIGNNVITIGDSAFFDCGSLANIAIPNSVTGIGQSAFQYCYKLTNATIGNGVLNIGPAAFYSCNSLAAVVVGNGITTINNLAFGNCADLTDVHFRGSAPGIGAGSTFSNSDNVTVYYLPGTTGWGPTFAGRPTSVWSLPYPVILNSGPSFGVQTNGFSFIISWATNLSVVVEACTNLVDPAWAPVGTNTLSGGSSYFSDPAWTNSPSRLYRLRSP